MQDRQEEGGGLAGAGLGGGDEVAAGEDGGMASAWMGVGSAYPISRVARTSAGFNPSALNGIRGSRNLRLARGTEEELYAVGATLGVIAEVVPLIAVPG